jgi:tRNA A37 threonylcarbamoyladenosine dehydratase
MQINPRCVVHRIYDFISTDNVYDIFDSINTDFGVVPVVSSSHGEELPDDTDATAVMSGCRNQLKRITAVLDCMDGAREKAALLAYCNHRSIPVCTVGSTAGRTNPSKVTFSDITNVYASPTMGHSRDRLLTTVRKELRQNYHFTPGRPFGRKTKPWHITGVYSEEEVIVPQQQSLFDTTVNIQNATTNPPMSTTTMTSSFRQCDNGVLGTASFVTGTFGFVAASIIVQGIAQNQLRPPQGTTTTATTKTIIAEAT